MDKKRINFQVHVEFSFSLNKTNKITSGHLFMGYYFQRTEMILFNYKHTTHTSFWAVFILTSRMSDLSTDLRRGEHEFISVLSLLCREKMKSCYLNNTTHWKSRIRPCF